MKLFGILSGLLVVLGAGLALYGPDIFSLGGWLTAAFLIAFAFIGKHVVLDEEKMNELSNLLKKTAAYLYIGALSGIFKVGLTWLILLKSRWGKAGWTQALVFGIGFGSIEALLFGFAGFGSALAGLLSPEVLPVYTLAIIFKTLLDAPAGFAAFWDAGTIENIWTLKIMIAVFGMAGILEILRISRRCQNIPYNDYITSG